MPGSRASRGVDASRTPREAGRSTSPTSGTEIRHSTVWTNGENVYWISGGSGESWRVRAHNAFMNSSGHRANVLRESFTSVGIGIAHGDGGWYLVQNFAN